MPLTLYSTSQKQLSVHKRTDHKSNFASLQSSFPKCRQKRAKMQSRDMKAHPGAVRAVHAITATATNQPPYYPILRELLHWLEKLFKYRPGTIDIQMRGLRLALGLPQSVPQCLVYREAGLLPFRRHIQLICSKYVFRCQTVDNSTVDEITATFRKPSRLQSYSSICDLVCDLVRSAGLDGVEVATRPMHPYPPWLLERAHVEVDMEGLMKDQNPLVLAVTARLCLEEKYQHHLKIFTDGSVMEDGEAGAAFVIPEFNNLTHSYSLPAVSVFTAELLAISMALQHISAIPVTPFAIVICSDSKAALTAIKSDSQNAREDLVREVATTTHQLITRGT